MQLYKHRDFGLMFSDTFTFIKENGKHFLGNYFRIMGIPLLILIIISYFFFKYYSSFTNNAIIRADNGIGSDVMLPGGMLAFSGIVLLFMIAFFVIYSISFAFAPTYLNLYSHYGSNFNHKDIIATMKSRSSKIIKFSLLLIPLLIVMSIPLILGSLILMITIIGILALPLFWGYFMLSIHTAYMEYLSTESDYMESMYFGFGIIRKNFWKSVGNAVLTYFIIQMVVSMVTFIPYYIYLFSQVALGTGNEDPTQFISVTVVYYIVSSLISIIIGSLIQINQGIIYYSLVDERSNVSSYSEIDEIGK